MIMAAGLGTRLRPLTGYIPKPMAPILNRPALYHILRLLQRHGVTEVVVNLHHHADIIRSWFQDVEAMGMSIRWAYEEQLLGTAGGVKNNEDFLASETFLVMSGDSVTDLDLAELLATHRAKGGLATIAVKEVDDPSDYGVVVVDGEDRVLGFQEKPSLEDALSNLCNCGIYVFEPAALERVPAGAFYDFGKQVFPEMVRDRLPFYVHRVSQYWNDVGNLEEYRRSNFEALSGLVAVEAAGRELSPGVRVGERTWVARGAVLTPPVLLGTGCVVEDGARLEGPVIVGDCCTVEAGALVREVILADAVLVGEGAQVEQSVVGRCCQIRSSARVCVAVLGDRCLVSEDARVSGVLEPNTALPPGASLP
jgi:NDP-sugar pyrophosphorylase family protein